LGFIEEYGLVNGMSFQQYFQSIIDRLQGGANIKTVYGDPITAEGKTIIPVAKVAYCFGAGIGPGASALRKEGEQRTEGKEGIGMGGGLRARPLGVVEITKEETKFIPIDERGKLAGMLLIGFFLGLVIAGRRSRK
jgi:uncharacterized spore protein YtfJ